jgi:hypothetical protein
MPCGVPYPPDLKARAWVLFDAGQTQAETLKTLRQVFPSLAKSTLQIWAKEHRKRRDGEWPTDAPEKKTTAGPATFSHLPSQAPPSPTTTEVIAGLLEGLLSRVTWGAAPAPLPPFMGDPSALRLLLRGVALQLEESTAATAAGFAAGDFERWADRGTRGEAPYAEFVRLLDQARCVGQLELHAAVLAGDTTGSVRAKWAAWILERRRPEQYKARKEMTTGPLDDTAGLGKAELEALLADDEGAR